MKGLHELHVWLGHCHVQLPEEELRPWADKEGNREVEQRHQRLFDLFGSVNVSSFTVHLTWKPVDVLAQRSWPFRVILYTTDEMNDILESELPRKTEPDLCDW